MAKIQIWREDNTGKDVPRLRLLRDEIHEDTIYLCAVDAEGLIIDGGKLMAIKDKGVRLLDDCPPDLGLPTDGDGRLTTY